MSNYHCVWSCRRTSQDEASSESTYHDVDISTTEHVVYYEMQHDRSTTAAGDETTEAPTQDTYESSTTEAVDEIENGRQYKKTKLN